MGSYGDPVDADVEMSLAELGGSLAQAFGYWLAGLAVHGSRS